MKLTERVNESIAMLNNLKSSIMADPNRSDTVILVKQESAEFVLEDAIELMTAFKNLLQFPYERG